MLKWIEKWHPWKRVSLLNLIKQSDSKYLQDLSRYEVKVKVTTCNVRHQLNTKTITTLGQGDQTPPPRSKVKVIQRIINTLPPKEGSPDLYLQHLHIKVGEDFHIKVNSRTVSSHTFLPTRDGPAPNFSHMHVATYVVKRSTNCWPIF